MSRHIIKREVPERCRIPDNIPEIPKFRTVICDPPWSRNQTGQLGGLRHYNLMDVEMIKRMPIQDLVDDNCVLWLWCTNGTMPDALSIIDAWGFTYRGVYVWCKPRLGLGSYYLRNSTELCLVATRGKVKFKDHSLINWGVYAPTKHSEKPRELFSMYEKAYDGPALELFCRRRPAHSEDFEVYCWGAETEGGSDIFLPPFGVKHYSFEKKGNKPDDEPTNAEEVK